MIRLIRTAFCVLCVASAIARATAAAVPASPSLGSPELVVYAYDSFVAQGGLGPEVREGFEKRCSCRLKLVGVGDGTQLVSRLKLDAERGKPGAQVVVGLDQNVWTRARELTESWGDWQPENYARIPSGLKIEKGFLPFDYGVLAFISDREQLEELKLHAPEKLEELFDPRWNRRLILEDPRTSTPGLGFVLSLRAKYGTGFGSAVARLRSQWLTLAPGWDAAYGLFLKKQAPLVWSYTTSQAYHEEHGDFVDEKRRRFRAVLFEKAPVQVEGVAIVKGGGQVALARAFLEYMTSVEVQEKVARKNWMYPAREGIKLPASFERLPHPARLEAKPVEEAEIKAALEAWSKALR